MTPIEAARAALEAAAKKCEELITHISGPAELEITGHYDLAEGCRNGLTNAAAAIRAIDPATVVKCVAKMP